MYKAPLSLFLITLPSRHCMTTREDIIEMRHLNLQDFTLPVPK